MKFSVIVPCYNERDNIDGLLRRQQNLQRRWNLEWVIVENGSTDDSKEYFRNYIEGKFEHIKIVYVDVNRGYGYGLQCGLKECTGDYIGWIHADMQTPPKYLEKFFRYAESNNNEKLFLKGGRKGRGVFDSFFSVGQSMYSSALFGTKLFDIGAIPVLFHKSLMDGFEIDEMPNDFSIELFIYEKAIKYGYSVKRTCVELDKRKSGNSSWNHGLYSKIKQSKVIFVDSIKIRKGEKVI